MKTSEELHALHKEQWGWAHKTGKSNREWPGWKTNGGETGVVQNLCFACAEAIERRQDERVSFCCFCPIGSCDPVWFDWDDAMHAGNQRKAKSLARKLRDLPWSPRPEVEA